MRRILIVACLLALVGCASAASTPPIPANLAVNVAPQSRLLDGGSGTPDVGQPAPDFSYTLAGGTTVKLSDLRGKKVIVNFWATWCDPCRAEMPDLQKIQQEYGDKVVVLGVNLREQADKMGPFLKEVPVTFPLVTNQSGDIAARYGVRQGVPISYFVNTDGTVGVWNAGAMSYDFIKQQIERLK